MSRILSSILSENKNEYIDPIAARLALTRALLGLTEKEFAGRAGVLLSRYHLWETGSIPISLSSAMKLCAAHGLTLDWLYCGKILGLPLWLAGQIEACCTMLDRDNEFRDRGRGLGRKISRKP